MTQPYFGQKRPPSLFEEWFATIPDDPPGAVPIELLATDPLPKEPVSAASPAAPEGSEPVEQDAPIPGAIRAAPVADDILARLSSGLSQGRRPQPMAGEARAVGPMAPPAPAAIGAATAPVVVSNSVLSGQPVGASLERSAREMPTVLSDRDDAASGEIADELPMKANGLRWKPIAAVLMGVVCIVVPFLLMSSRTDAPPATTTAETIEMPRATAPTSPLPNVPAAQLSPPNAATSVAPPEPSAAPIKATAVAPPAPTLSKAVPGSVAANAPIRSNGAPHAGTKNAPADTGSPPSPTASASASSSLTPSGFDHL